MMRRVVLTAVFLCVAIAAEVVATQTERLYLSGKGPEDARDWEFSIDRGRRSGEWTTIPVPSQWELEGFGEFAYGRDDEVRAEVGTYRTRFTLPDGWRGRRVFLVFEGVMTDLEAVLNGHSVGDRHRGGFTRFSYEVTRLVRFGEAWNVLEAEVSEASTEGSVNAAERDADYWVFGGIYRPVYLESRPAVGVEHVAIDARHDGSVRVEVEVVGGLGNLQMVSTIVDSGGKSFGGLRLQPVRLDDVLQILVGHVPGIVPWSAENPRLYFLQIEVSRDGNVLHRTRHRFGFRTVEVRAGEGLFINGHRTLLKGINRHSFWPTSGRTLSREQNRRDVELIKDLNANAVRSSHYPPDPAFLEACDESGLYVIDELPGWHDAYRSDVGRRLVGEMVRRDVNHPSVILWANGNEGGWNRALDDEFRTHDPQGRPVIHPQSVFGGFDTTHYPSWEELRLLVDGEGLTNWLRSWLGPLPLVMPTEMLHGLYDGGIGAGLADFWQLIRSSPRGAGAFLWAFLDEAVLRGDRDGELDSFGNYALDGIVGPYREKEASYATVRSVWSPIALSDTHFGSNSVRLHLENRFAETDLAACRFRWRWLRWPRPASGAQAEVLASGEAVGPRVVAGESGELVIHRVSDSDALELQAVDPTGRTLWVWVLPASDRSDLVRRWLPEMDDKKGRPMTEASAVESLQLVAPGLVPSLAASSWHEYPSGWLRLEIDLDDKPLVFPEAVVEAREVEWLGRGPTPVWRNRLQGPQLGIWKGRALPGFYDGVLWARIPGARGALYVIVESPSLFMGFSAPRFPEDARFARADVPPSGSLSLLSSIPAMGSKFHPAVDLGPPPTEAALAPEGKAVMWFFREPSQE